MSASHQASTQRYWIGVRLRSRVIHPLRDEYATLIDAQKTARNRARTIGLTSEGEGHHEGGLPMDKAVLPSEASSIVVMFDTRPTPVREFSIHRHWPLMDRLLSNRCQQLGHYTRKAGYLSLLGLWSPVILVTVQKFTRIPLPDALLTTFFLCGLVVFVVCIPVLIYLSIRYLQRPSVSAVFAMLLGASPIFFFLYILNELGHHGMF